MIKNKGTIYFSSESVAEGHPDKVCDQIADAILDEALRQDANSRVACEVTATSGLVVVLGEITTEGYVSIPKIVHEVVEEIGYDRIELGFDSSCAVLSAIDEQSADIAMGVSLDKSGAESVGAGDQGMMFGFAINETDRFLPLAFDLSHRLTARLSEARKSGALKFLRPDGKGQVTVKYVDGVPSCVDTVVLSAQHEDWVSNEELREGLLKEVIEPSIGQFLTKETKFHINPTGRFVVGGPKGDTGLTGRKIIVDTYGGYCAHGGGSFSGKDPTKVDRSAAYMARFACKNVVAAGLAAVCELQVAYAIGRAEPVSLYVNTYGTGKISDDELLKLLKQRIDFRPYAIIERLDLKKPIYRQTAKNGHFGNPLFAWEKIDKGLF